MKYQTKLMCVFIATGLLSSSVGMWILYHQVRPVIFQDEQIKALAVSATTASLLNPELLEQIQTPEDVDSPAFQTIKRQLRRARDANRRKNIHINFLYTIRPDPKNPHAFIALIDPEDDPKKASAFGIPDKNRYSAELLQHLMTNYSPPKTISDQWGIWLSGFSPVLDAKGKYVATVRADISVDQYLHNLHQLEWLICVGFASSVFIAFLTALIMSRGVTRSLNTLMKTVSEIGKGNLDAKTELHTHDEFEDLGNEMNKMTTGLLERERLKQNFARYVSSYVLEKIVKSETPTKLEGEKRKITVLFSDIQEFINLSNQIPPPVVLSMLNEYFEVMLEIIFSHQGTLDKFITGIIMVEFGAPLDDAIQEKHAVAAAILMQKAFEKLSQKWKAEGKPSFQMGIGIHTGLAVVGNVGTEKRISYTAIGDTVNVAARLEQSTKKLNAAIVISQVTYDAVKDEFQADRLGPIELHGRTEPIIAYAIRLGEQK